VNLFYDPSTANCFAVLSAAEGYFSPPASHHRGCGGFLSPISCRFKTSVCPSCFAWVAAVTLFFLCPPGAVSEGRVSFSDPPHFQRVTPPCFDAHPPMGYVSHRRHPRSSLLAPVPSLLSHLEMFRGPRVCLSEGETPGVSFFSRPFPLCPSPCAFRGSWAVSRPLEIYILDLCFLVQAPMSDGVFFPPPQTLDICPFWL